MNSVLCSSNPGDVVLDPFCGCGTTIDAAEKLGRDWIGIDVTQLAISLIKNRLQVTYGSRLKFVSGPLQRRTGVAPISNITETGISETGATPVPRESVVRIIGAS